MGLQTTCVPLCPKSQGAAWTLANPWCKMEQRDEVWPSSAVAESSVPFSGTRGM